jgi:hypothetical protein
MRAYEMSLKSEKFSDLDVSISALYLLAAPSTPEEVRAEIIKRAEAGENLPIAEIKRTIKSSKKPATPKKTRSEANIAKADAVAPAETVSTEIVAKTATGPRPRRPPATTSTPSNRPSSASRRRRTRPRIR